MVTLLTPRFIPFFLVLWIISQYKSKCLLHLNDTDVLVTAANVSVVFFPVEMLPTIFRYGYATPFYNLGNATRTILFGTRNQGERSCPHALPYFLGSDPPPMNSSGPQLWRPLRVDRHLPHHDPDIPEDGAEQTGESVEEAKRDGARAGEGKPNERW